MISIFDLWLAELGRYLSILSWPIPPAPLDPSPTPAVRSAGQRPPPTPLATGLEQLHDAVALTVRRRRDGGLGVEWTHVDPGSGRLRRRCEALT